MGLSDCPKCWDTPCGCGHQYEQWTEERLRDHIKMLEMVLAKKQAQRYKGESK